MQNLMRRLLHRAIAWIAYPGYPGYCSQGHQVARIIRRIIRRCMMVDGSWSLSWKNTPMLRSSEGRGWYLRFEPTVHVPLRSVECCLSIWSMEWPPSGRAHTGTHSLAPASQDSKKKAHDCIGALRAEAHLGTSPRCP